MSTIEAHIKRANIYRHAAQDAPTPRQAQAAHAAADREMRRAKEASK